MIKRFEHRGDFAALDEQGKRYMVEIHVEVLSAPTPENPHGEKDGMTRLLFKGKTVRRLSQGKYRMLHGGTELSSNDPSAP